MVTLVINANEKQDMAIFDVPGAFCMQKPPNKRKS